MPDEKVEINKEILDAYQKIDGLKAKLDRFRPLSPEQVDNLKRVFDVDKSLGFYLETLGKNIFYN